MPMLYTNNFIIYITLTEGKVLVAPCIIRPQFKLLIRKRIKISSCDLRIRYKCAKNCEFHFRRGQLLLCSNNWTIINVNDCIDSCMRGKINYLHACLVWKRCYGIIYRFSCVILHLCVDKRVSLKFDKNIFIILWNMRRF